MNFPDDEETQLTGTDLDFDSGKLDLRENSKISRSIDFSGIDKPEGEVRRHPRYGSIRGYSLRLILKKCPGGVGAILLDLSAGGCRISLPGREPTEASVVAMELFCAENLSTINLVGKVVRVSERDGAAREIAIEFQNPSLLARNFITQALDNGELLTDDRWLGDSSRAMIRQQRAELAKLRQLEILPSKKNKKS